VVECRAVGLRLLRFSHLQVVGNLSLLRAAGCRAAGLRNLRVFRLRVCLRYLHQFRAGHQRILECLRCLRACLNLLRAAGLHSNLRALVIGAWLQAGQAVVPTSSYLRAYLSLLRAAGLHSNLRALVIGTWLQAGQADLATCFQAAKVVDSQVCQAAIRNPVGLVALLLLLVFRAVGLLRFLVECLNRLHRKMLAGERQRFRR